MRKIVAIIGTLTLLLMFAGCGQLKEVLSAQAENRREAAETGEADTDSGETDTGSGEADTDSEEEDLVEVTLGQYSGSYSVSDEFQRCSLEVTVVEGAADVNYIYSKGQENWASGVIADNTFSADITGYDEYYRTGELKDLRSGRIDITFGDNSATVTVKWEDNEQASTIDMKRMSDDSGKKVEITRESYEQFLGYLE